MFFFFAAVLTFSFIIRCFLILVRQPQATCLADTSASLFLASLWMGTFVFASVALSAFPIMLFFFTTVLTLALVVRFLLILVLCLITTYLADTLSVFFLPATCVSTFRFAQSALFAVFAILPYMV